MNWLQQGQERRQWLNALMADTANYYLGPTGIPNRLAAAGILNPINDMEQAGQNAQRVARGDMGAVVPMVTDMATVLAPVAGSRMVGGDDAAAVIDAFLGIGGPAREGMKDAGRRFAADESGALTMGRSGDVAQERGKTILDMLASGRSSEVTDEMLDLGDPTLNARLNEYLFNNYDLPMDEASRMARAREMGFDTDAYSSSLQDKRAFDPVGKFMGYTGTSGISASDSAEAASRYLDRYGNVGWVDGVPNQPFNKNVMPLVARTGKTVERVAPYPSNIGTGAPLPGDYVPAHVRDGYDTAVFPDAISRRGPVKHSAAKNAIRSNEYVMSDPTAIRSRFARFDPRLAHLRNLSAGVAGGAVALSPAEEIEAYLNGVER